MGKKFMGLDGTDHFWDRAKAWILNQITSAGMDKQSVIDAVYPVGSLYWSSKSTSPATLFGGTWVQIKDKFVLAAGSTYTAGATGGASTVTLSVSNMPSHSHTFTPSGKITMNSHSHGLNGHTHSFSGTTGNMSANSTGSWGTRVSNSKNDGDGSDRYTPYSTGNISYSTTQKRKLWQRPDDGYTASTEHYFTINVQHTHSFSGTTGGNSENTTSVTSKGSFNGTQGTTSSNGSGTAFNILPPYVVKYCWERTA